MKNYRVVQNSNFNRHVTLGKLLEVNLETFKVRMEGPASPLRESPSNGLSSRGELVSSPGEVVEGERKRWMKRWEDQDMCTLITFLNEVWFNVPFWILQHLFSRCSFLRPNLHMTGFQNSHALLHYGRERTAPDIASALPIRPFLRWKCPRDVQGSWD